MTNSLSRRDFLKFSGLCAGALVLPASRSSLGPWPPQEGFGPQITVRVATSFINIYQQPDFKSKKLGLIRRDALLHPAEQIESPYGPAYNPRWYRLVDGYIHSGHLQRVERAHLNKPLSYVPEGGRLGEITVPISQSLRKTRTQGWLPLYRLYYRSVHWITAIEEGPDGKPWYSLLDELLRVHYSVPAAHVRPVDPDELAPISPEVPDAEKKIVVSIPEQTLTAYEAKEVVLHVPISSGLRDTNLDESDFPTDTPTGIFHVQVKVPSKHMGDGNLTDDPEAYELPGVPWVSFFHPKGVAFHGAYWHDNFGRKMSHGCVNMRVDDAKWLYRWSSPLARASDWNSKGYGTIIKIEE